MLPKKLWFEKKQKPPWGAWSHAQNVSPLPHLPAPPAFIWKGGAACRFFPLACLWSRSQCRLRQCSQARAQASLGRGSRVPLAVPAETGGLLQVLPVCANKSLLSDILKDFQQYLFLKAVPLHLHYYLHINHNSNDQFFKKALFLNLSFFSDFKMRHKDIRPIFQKLELI